MRITVYKTQDSTYEASLERRLIRRIDGDTDPTDRQGADGKWKPYAVLQPSFQGLLIGWKIEGEDEDGNPILKSTLTSPLLHAYVVEGSLCPECAAAKHTNCDGQAWDDTRDVPVFCCCDVSAHLQTV